MEDAIDTQTVRRALTIERVDDTRTTDSALDAALARVGDRWSFLVVESLLEGPRRFNELAAAVSGIAPNILTDRLRRLEREGVLIGRRYSERPQRMAYSLTEDGLELAGVLRLLAVWGARRSAWSEGLRHVACGSLLEARWYCPTCSRTIDDDDEASALRFA
ncbi:MAG: helix-turn-helix domain-containing protein [Candidatus Limnocylindrales bacterium]